MRRIPALRSRDEEELRNNSSRSEIPLRVDEIRPKNEKY